MTPSLPGIESLSLLVNEEIRVRASLDATFTALLEQLGPYNEMPDGTPMPIVRQLSAARQPPGNSQNLRRQHRRRADPAAEVR